MSETVDAAVRRWAEAAALLGCAGRTPSKALTWLGPAWTGPAARGYGAWAALFEQACGRAAGAVGSVADSLRVLTASWPELGHDVDFGAVDAGARGLADVPVPGGRGRTSSGRQPARERASPAPKHPEATVPPMRPGAPRPPQRERPTGSVPDWIEQAVRILLEHGYRREQIDPDAIATIIKHESNGNPSAVNRWDSNAERGTPSMGLMQTIGPTFARWHLPGHEHILDPVDNIIAGVRYAVARYGSVSQVPGLLSLARGEGYRGY